MGWKRTQFEKKMELKNKIKAFNEKGINADWIHICSDNADNRHYCWGCCKEKYCYETEEKARKSTEFVHNKQRVYYCELCAAYHTTSKMRISDIKTLSNGFSAIEAQ